MIWVKIIMVLIALGGAGGAVWDYIDTKQDNAVLSASLERTELEVQGWSAAAQILSTKYQTARDERDEKIKRITTANIAKMAIKHPGMLATRINAGTVRMFADIENATRRNRITTTTTP